MSLNRRFGIIYADSGIYSNTGTTSSSFTVDSDSVLGKVVISATTGASNKALTITNTALTDNRTATFPDASGTVAYTSQVRHVVNLTAGKQNATLASAGVDLADGSGGTYYGCFVAPYDLVLVKMYDYLTEAYVKDTTDAKIEVYNDAGTPVKLFGRTLTAAGEAAKSFHSTNPETGAANVTAGTRLDLKITSTGAGSGTGHALVFIEYAIAP